VELTETRFEGVFDGVAAAVTDTVGVGDAVAYGFGLGGA
jgi:hypothetical protein